VHDFAAKLDISATALQNLGLDAVSIEAQMRSDRYRRLRPTACERPGCSEKTTQICGICKNHTCIYRGCLNPQKKCGFCTLHNNVYRYLKPN